MTHVTPRAFPTLGATALLVALAGCAARGGVLPRPEIPSFAVDPADRDRCEAFAHTEAEVAQRHAISIRAGERATLERNAAARLSEAESLGYRAWRVGPGIDASLDLRPFTTAVASLVLIPAAVIEPIASAGERIYRQRTAHKHALKECLSAANPIPDPGSDLGDVARSLYELAIRFGAQARV